MYFVGLSILHQRDYYPTALVGWISIQQDLSDAPINTVRVLHADLVMCASEAVIHLKSRPIAGDAGVDAERLAHPGDAQDGFEAQAVHPA